MQKNRPINLNLFTIRFPVTAISSILHRGTGVILFLGIVFFLYLLNHSLKSADSFASLQICFQHPLSKFFLWVLLSALIYHLIAGIRHLFMDCGLGEGKVSGRLSAYGVIILSFVLIIALGVRIW